MPNEDSLPDLPRYILASIRREAPLLTSVLKSDCRTLKSNGAEWADENRVLRVLGELEGLGLIERTQPGANDWRPVYAVQKVKARQGSLGFDW